MTNRQKINRKVPGKGVDAPASTVLCTRDHNIVGMNKLPFESAAGCRNARFRHSVTVGDRKNRACLHTDDRSNLRIRRDHFVFSQSTFLRDSSDRPTARVFHSIRSVTRSRVIGESSLTISLIWFFKENGKDRDRD